MMEQKRLELHEKLCEILDSRHVYFQPPESLKMAYPAIVYSRSDVDDIPANNDVYDRKVRYQITLIDSDPDSGTIEKLLNLKYCAYDRHFNSDNLNNDIFTLFY